MIFVASSFVISFMIRGQDQLHYLTAGSVHGLQGGDINPSHLILRHSPSEYFDDVFVPGLLRLVGGGEAFPILHGGVRAVGEQKTDDVLVTLHRGLVEGGIPIVSVDGLYIRSAFDQLVDDLCETAPCRQRQRRGGF